VKKETSWSSLTSSSVIALVIALIAFVVQTETAGYLATTLNYRKPIFILYLTHSSWATLWPLQVVFLRIRKRHLPFRIFLRRHLNNVKSTAFMVISGESHHGSREVPPSGELLRYMVKSCLILSTALNIAGSMWYIAVNLTTPADLTAIYNCSAFCAYAFSVPLLKEPFRWDKAFSVCLSIVGVIIVAYAGSTEGDVSATGSEDYPYRAWGNVVIAVGAVLYGLYEVMYKRMACPPQAVSARKQAAFANVVGSTIGTCTFLWLWPILPILHFTGFETFELPHGDAFWVLVVSVIANATFSGSFLILMSLTSPVLSSVAALLTTFLVAVVDKLLFGTPISFGGIVGGVIIIGAFGLLAYASWRELVDEGDDDENND
jgi:drug/metabolite transporter (DMT)-like permease